MCGIVGLFFKNPALGPTLGRHISGMLGEMSVRGPDSAGIAIYHRPVPPGITKMTLFHPDPAYGWTALAADLSGALAVPVEIDINANHGVLLAGATEGDIAVWLGRHQPELRIMGFGQAMEVYKDVGLPTDVTKKYRIEQMTGTHAIGHTRMATESAVTTEHSHPFTAAADMCLVHNGSLSNHNNLRRQLRRLGHTFDTDNDSEVAARYFAWRLGQGATLAEALEAGLSDLDGFYTFAMSTRDGFAVLRDGVGCKPAVLAETDDWVSMASEYRSLARLPGIEQAAIWEPQPATVYSWTMH